jgi:hypothetical protein
LLTRGGNEDWRKVSANQDLEVKRSRSSENMQYEMTSILNSFVLDTKYVLFFGIFDHGIFLGIIIIKICSSLGYRAYHGMFPLKRIGLLIPMFHRSREFPLHDSPFASHPSSSLFKLFFSKPHDNL